MWGYRLCLQIFCLPHPVSEKEESGKGIKGGRKKGIDLQYRCPAVAQGFGKQRELCEQDPFFEEKVAYCILQAARSKYPG